jgi:histidyl-tRNA synthetase
VDAFVVPVGEEMMRAAREVIGRLRRRGTSADGPYKPLKIGKALKQASRAGARRAVIVGGDEWTDGVVKVKDLQSGEESTVRVEELE